MKSYRFGTTEDKNKNSGKMMLVLMILATFSLPGILCANNYPKNGQFKQLSESMDWWYYVDNVNWEIKAPDKWTHMMGSMSSSLLLSKVMNKYAAGLLVFTFGAFKEYDDAFREGWSYRDLIADALGVVSSFTANEKYRLFCKYDNEKVLLVLSITIR